MDRPLTDPPPRPLTEPPPQHLTNLEVSMPSTHSGASPEVSAQLQRYEIAVVLKAIYEWGGYRYTNAGDAIAAARRGKPSERVQ